MELFKDEEVASKSPYLLWLEKHDIKTKYRTDLGPDTPPWEAWIGDYEKKMLNAMTSGECYPDEHNDFVWAESEREAVLELARRNKIPCDYFPSYNVEM